MDVRDELDSFNGGQLLIVYCTFASARLIFQAHATMQPEIPISMGTACLARLTAIGVEATVVQGSLVVSICGLASTKRMTTKKQIRSAS